MPKGLSGRYYRKPDAAGWEAVRCYGCGQSWAVLPNLALLLRAVRCPRCWTRRSYG